MESKDVRQYVLLIANKGHAMLKSRSLGIILYYCPLLCVLTGCLRSPDSYGPFDDEELRLMSVSRKQNASLSKAGDNLIFDISDEQMPRLNRLLASLSPIKSAKTGELRDNDVDYVLSFQPGRNPVLLKIHLAGDHLVYAERRYVYEGGDVKSFKQEVDAIMAASRGKPGGIVDGRTSKQTGEATNKD